MNFNLPTPGSNAAAFVNKLKTPQSSFSSPQPKLPNLGQDTLTLKFASTRPNTAIDPSPFLDEEQNEYYNDPALKNLAAAKIVAKGTSTVAGDSVTAKTLLNQALKAPVTEGYTTLAIAELYANGYYTIQKNPQAALRILNQLIKESANAEDSAYLIAEASIIKIRDLGKDISPEARLQAIEDLKTAASQPKATMNLQISTARFLANELNQQDEALRFADLAEESACAWNARYDAENPRDNSKGSLGARDSLALAKNIIRGEKGFEKNLEKGRLLLESLVARVETPNPVLKQEAAQIFAQDLGDTKRAGELVDHMLTKTGFPQYLPNVALIARDLKDTARAEKLLQAAEKDPSILKYSNESKLSPSIKTEMAKIYAKHLNKPEKALQLIESFDFDEIGSHQKTVLLTDMAVLYGQNLGSPEKAASCLDEAKKWIQWGGSGNPQEVRIGVAQGYLDALKDTASAVEVLQEAVAEANRYITPEDEMKTVLKVLDSCDQSNPEVEQTRIAAKAIIDKELKRGDTSPYASIHEDEDY